MFKCGEKRGQKGIMKAQWVTEKRNQEGIKGEKVIRKTQMWARWSH